MIITMIIIILIIVIMIIVRKKRRRKMAEIGSTCASIASLQEAGVKPRLR